MRTALEKLQYAIELEKMNPKVYLIDLFRFQYGLCHIGFEGHYFAMVYEDGQSGENEYCWDDYDDMLDCVIEETGKTMRQMLSELSELDLDIRY